MENSNVDGSVTIGVDLDDKEAMKELNRLRREIKSLEKSIEDMRIRRSPLAEEMNEYAAQLDKAKAKLAELKYLQKQDEAVLSGGGIGQYDEYMRAYERQGEIAADIAKQEAEVKRLEKAWKDVSEKVREYDTRIGYAEEKLEKSKVAAGEMAVKVASVADAQEQMAKASDKAHKNMSKFSMRLREVVRSALVFTVISQAFASLREWFAKVLKTNDDVVSSFSRLKGEAMTLANLFIEKVLPVLPRLIDMVTNAISALTKFLAPLFGTTAEEAENAAEKLYNETEALDDVSNAAKNARKSLVSFDEINRLESPASAQSSTQNDTIKPTFGENAANATEKAMSELEVYLSGALFVIGAVLAFSGASVGLGLAMMVIGGANLAEAVSANWDTLRGPLTSAILEILGIGGALMFVSGVILAFAGANLLMGLALMVAGFTAVAVAVSLNDGQLSDTVLKAIGVILGLGGAIFFVAGLVIALTGAGLLKGIALMAAGALAVVAAVKASWGALNDDVKMAVDAVIAIGGAILFVSGLILALTGVKIAIGLALIAAGAVAIVSAATPIWSSLNDDVKGSIEGIMKIGGTLLFCVGLLLTLSGVHTALGIALLLTGAAALFAPAVLDWASGVSDISDAISEVLAIGGALLLVAGLILVLTGVGTAAGLAMMAAGAAALFGSSAGGGFDPKSLIDAKALPPEMAKHGWELRHSLGVSQYYEQVPIPGIEFSDDGKSFTINGERHSINEFWSFDPDSTSPVASGQITPPNAEYDYMLRDNAFSNAKEYMNGLISSRANFSGSGNSITLELDGKVLGRAVLPAINDEQTRVGTSLAGRYQFG